MEERISGYLTKYALSVGIRKVENVELVEHGYATGRYIDDRYGSRFFVKDGSDFVRTREEAEVVAKKMATCKIKSLEKQIIKLRVLAEQPKWLDEG